MTAPGQGLFDATFDFAEETGPARLCHFRFEDLMLSVLTSEKAALKPGDRVGLRVAPGAVHLFDAGTGRRLDAQEVSAQREFA